MGKRACLAVLPLGDSLAEMQAVRCSSISRSCEEKGVTVGVEIAPRLTRRRATLPLYCGRDPVNCWLPRLSRCAATAVETRLLNCWLPRLSHSLLPLR